MPEFSINPSDVMVKFTAPNNKIVPRPSGVTDRGTDAERRVLDKIRIDSGYSYVMIA